MPSPAHRCAALRPTAVNSILAEVKELQAEGRDLISLMRGEPDLATPESIVTTAMIALRRGRTMYPDNQGEPALREAVAARLARDRGLQYSPENEILITTGATMGIYAALVACLNPGEEILVPQPIYDAYLSPIHLAGGIPRPVPADIRAGRFVLDPARVAEAVTPWTRALLLNHPWNPTGTVFDREELRDLARVVIRHDLMLLSDEIYDSVLYGDREFVSPAALSDEMRSRTILINSFSKTYAMTGWRLGYCAAPAPWIRAMYLVLQQSSRGPATFIQDAGAAALNGSQACVERMRTEYAGRRARVIDWLTGIPAVRVLPPEGGFFAMLDVRALWFPSDEIRRRLLHEHGVVVVHGAAYGPPGEGTLRVSFATGGTTLDKGLRRLRTGLEKLAASRC